MVYKTTTLPFELYQHWRQGWDLNPRFLSEHQFSRLAPLAGLGHLANLNASDRNRTCKPVAHDPKSCVFANFTTEACCQFSFFSPLTTTDAPDTILVPLLLLNLPYSQVAVNSILVLVMGLEPTRRIRQQGLSLPSMPIRVHQ